MAGASPRGLSAWPPDSGYASKAESSFFTGFIRGNAVLPVLYYRLFLPTFYTFSRIRVTKCKVMHQNSMLRLIYAFTFAYECWCGMDSAVLIDCERLMFAGFARRGIDRMESMGELYICSPWLVEWPRPCVRDIYPCVRDIYPYECCDSIETSDLSLAFTSTELISVSQFPCGSANSVSNISGSHCKIASFVGEPAADGAPGRYPPRTKRASSWRY